MDSCSAWWRWQRKSKVADRLGSGASVCGLGLGRYCCAKRVVKVTRWTEVVFAEAERNTFVVTNGDSELDRLLQEFLIRFSVDESTRPQHL